MENTLYRKVIILQVLVLFIGAGLQSAFAVNIFESTFYDNVETEVFYNVDITRERIIEIAEAYLTHEWYPTGSNVFHGNCPYCGKWVDTPDSGFYGSGWVSGESNIGVPYQWGGFSSISGLNLSNEEDFDEQYTGTGEYAGIIHYGGDIHTQGSQCSRACGVDCSGFVSRCWNLPTKKSTSTLPGISNQIKYEYLKPGDILDKPGYHVILFKEFVNEEKTLIRTIEANFPKVFENIYSAEASQDGYSVTLNGWVTYQIYSYENIPNNIPDAPTIEGPANGRPGDELTYIFNAIDPDGEDVRFHVDWGDGITHTTDYVASGTDKTVSHVWGSQGSYTITAYAEDENGAYGPTATWTVVIPRNKANNYIYQYYAEGVIPSTAGIIEKKTTTTIPGSRGYIQDLIDNASDGDTINVPSGIYYENIIIDKSISLIGEDKDITIIDGGGIGDVIYVTADWVNISGFTIQNSGENWGDAGIDIEMFRNNHTITSNLITNNKNYGIRLYRHNDNNRLIENSIISNEGTGIILDDDCDENEIFDNIITSNFIGIRTQLSSDNIIKGNQISLNEFGILNSACHNDIIENEIFSNYYNGIELSSSKNVNIIGNIISMNKNFGIKIGSITSNSFISGNLITDNNMEGIYIYLMSNNNIICRNNFIDEDTCDKADNFWDDGKYGNYWSDYKLRYPDAKPKLFKPWMWDTPYEIPGDEGNMDNCPLVEQWPNSASIDIQRNKVVNNPYLTYLQNHPFLFPLLQKLL